MDLVYLRIGWWVKAWWSNFPYSPEEVRRNPTCLKLLKKKKELGRPECAWEKPQHGTLKWNVDASMKTDSGAAGIGGVLRDDQGRFKAIFYGPITAEDINTAEVLAVAQALLLSRSSEEVWRSRIMIESDSLNATTWSNCKQGGKWGIQLVLNRIWSLVEESGRVQITQRNRESNGVADSLAKLGVNREAMFMAWL